MNTINLTNGQSASDFLGLRVFFDICKLWGMSHEQSLILLGANPRYPYQTGETEVAPPELTAESNKRISYVLGIFANLQLLLPDSKASDKWMSAANSAPIFNGKSALEKIMTGDINDLEQVHQYLYALSVGN